ncbi:MAG: hypothetical protein IIZ92_00190 [Aquincola sp.]|nr:hypothetical protein [Aquincola sp.]
MPRVFLLRSDAPAKPLPGQPCNGCGVCCAAEPCPAGMLVSRRRTGRCRALRWAGERYRCGLVTDPARHLPRTLRWLAPLLRRLALRWISAGSGCDSLAVVEPGSNG